MTPNMLKMANSRDARDLLAEQVNESVLRLKKAKFGHRLNEIVPEHTNQFYLPDKSSYFPKEKIISNNSALSSTNGSMMK